jgi:uncharacterized protein YjiS (DUF1127 family)
MSGRAILGDPHAAGTPALSGVAAAWAAVASVISTLVTSVQTARMASALAELSDAQLAQIGIQRHEIFNHAEKLIADDKKA